MLSNITKIVIFCRTVWELRKDFFFLWCNTAKARLLQRAFTFLFICSSPWFHFVWSPVALFLNWSSLTLSRDSCFSKRHEDYLPEASCQNSVSLTAFCLLFMYLRTILDFRITWRISTLIWWSQIMSWHYKCCF